MNDALASEKLSDVEQVPVRRRGVLERLLGRWFKDYEEVSYDWHRDSHRAYLEQQPLRARSLLYGIIIVFVAVVIWASIAKIDEVTRGPGQVIPSRKVQVIQSQDGGVVTEIHVGDGDVVKRGQLLIKLDQTRSQSSFRENRAEYQALVVKADRLRAVVEVTDFKPDPSLTEAIPRIVAQEMALFHSSKAELSLQQEIAQQQLVQAQEQLREESAKERQLARSQELTEEEADLTRPMVESGAVSQVEILRLEKKLNDLSGEHDQSVAKIERLKSAIEEARRNLDAVKLEFVNDAREELADTLSRMNALREAGAGLSDRVKQTAVRSPVNGTIKQLHHHTIGGVVLPGREIVEIVPLDDSLLVEVRIRPEDIAFLVPGQEALVKFTAYDFAVYGGLPGTLENIGVDTLMDPDGKPYYPVRVRTGQSNIGQDMPIIPGMVVEVDILTGKKSILAYLLKPVLRAKQVALTER